MSEIRTNILEWIVLYEITINFVFSLVRAERRNKGPTGPHVVHLSTMRHLFNGSARAAIFVNWSAKKNTDLVEDVEILLFVTFRWIPFSVIRREIENVSEIRHRGGHFAFPIGPKNKNLVEDVDILSSFVKFHSAVSEEKSKISQRIRGRVAIIFFRSAQKHKLGRER